MTEPLISRQEIAILNAARTVLKAVEDRGTSAPDVDRGNHAFAAGMANIAEDTLFTVLNVAKNYCHVPMTDAEVHNGYQGEPAPLPEPMTDAEVHNGYQGEPAPLPEWTGVGDLEMSVRATVIGALMRWTALGGDFDEAVAALEAIDPHGADYWPSVLGPVVRILHGSLARATADALALATDTA